MSKDDIKKLTKFAELFDPTHIEIRKEGYCGVDEYNPLWHYYNNEIRPMLERDGIVSVLGYRDGVLQAVDDE